MSGADQEGEPARRGRGWLDPAWSDELLAPGAVGWDWIGINLLDGGALTAFVLRRADGSVVWAGGSHRPPGGAVQRRDRRAHRHTDHLGAAQAAIGHRGENPPRHPGAGPVGQPGPGIGLVDHHRDPAAKRAAGGQVRRQRHVTAEADHHVGVEAGDPGSQEHRSPFAFHADPDITAGENLVPGGGDRQGDSGQGLKDQTAAQQAHECQTFGKTTST